MPIEHWSTLVGSSRIPTHPSSDVDRASSRGFWIEKKPAVWMAFVGLVGAFGDWGYTSFLSGHEIASLELCDNTPYDRPADMAALPEGLPAGYWAGPPNLDAVDDPMRAVLSMVVSRGRERVKYRLVGHAESTVLLAKQSGTELSAWPTSFPPRGFLIGS